MGPILPDLSIFQESQVSWLSPLVPALKFQRSSQRTPSKNTSSALPLPSPGTAAHSAPGESPPNSTCLAPQAPRHLTVSPPLSLLTQQLQGLPAVSPGGQAIPLQPRPLVPTPATSLTAPLSLPSSVCSNVSFSVKPTQQPYFTCLPWHTASTPSQLHL